MNPKIFELSLAPREITYHSPLRAAFSKKRFSSPIGSTKCYKTGKKEGRKREKKKRDKKITNEERMYIYIYIHIYIRVITLYTESRLGTSENSRRFDACLDSTALTETGNFLVHISRVHIPAALSFVCRYHRALLSPGEIAAIKRDEEDGGSNVFDRDRVEKGAAL